MYYNIWVTFLNVPTETFDFIPFHFICIALLTVGIITKQLGRNSHVDPGPRQGSNPRGEMRKKAREAFSVLV